MERIKRYKKETYTSIDNSIFNEKNLSCKAIGFHCKVMSLSENWDFTVSGIVKILKEGRDAIDGAINELVEFGFIYKEQVRNEKSQFAGVDYHFYENPFDNPYFGNSEPYRENPNTEKPNTENPKQVITVLSNYQLSNNKQENLFEDIPLNIIPKLKESAKPKKDKKTEFNPFFEEAIKELVSYYNSVSNSCAKHTTKVNYKSVHYGLEYIIEQYELSIEDAKENLKKYFDYRWNQTKPNKDGFTALKLNHYNLITLFRPSLLPEHYEKMQFNLQLNNTSKPTELSSGLEGFSAD